MSVDILGERDTTRRSCLRRSAASARSTPTASLPAPAPPRSATICRSCRPSTSHGVEDVIKARGAPIWYQLYATNKLEVAKAITRVRERPAAPPWRGHRRSQRRPQSGDAVPAAAGTTPATATPATTAPVCRPISRAAPMYQGPRHQRAPQHSVLRHDLGVSQADSRHHQDEDGDQGHPGLGGCGARRRHRRRRHYRLQPRRAQRGLRAARPSTRCRRSSRR